MVFYIYTFIISSCITSFINCISYRYINRENSFLKRSHCDYCGHTLSCYDLIPVVSFVINRGRCRYCNHSISLFHPLSELLLSLFSIFLFVNKGISAENVIVLMFIFCLYGISLTDIKTYEIDDRFLVSGVVLWLINNVFNVGLHIQLCTSALMFFLITLIMLMCNRLFRKQTMGVGDIKMITVMALYLNLMEMMFLLCISSLMALAYMVFTNRKIVPFGPFLAFGFVIVFMCL